MDHRIEKLPTLLDLNEAQLNGEISIECENVINETSENNNSCSSTIKVEPKSKRFKVNLLLENTNVKRAKKNFQAKVT